MNVLAASVLASLATGAFGTGSSIVISYGDTNEPRPEAVCIVTTTRGEGSLQISQITDQPAPGEVSTETLVIVRSQFARPGAAADFCQRRRALDVLKADVAANKFVVCRRRGSLPDNGRVLLVEAEMKGANASAPTIDNLQLTSATFSFTLSSAPGAFYLALQVLDGDFVGKTFSRPVIGNVGELTPEPSCTETTLVLPRTTSAYWMKEKLTLRSWTGASTSVTPQPEVRVWLPRTASSTSSRQLSLTSNDGLVLGAELGTAKPPARLDVAVHEFPLTFEPDTCLHPKDACPELSQPEGLATCVAAAANDTLPCRYRCSATNGATTFPLELRVSHQQGAWRTMPPWLDHARGAKDVLRGLPQPERRVWQVDTSPWTAKPRADDTGFSVKSVVFDAASASVMRNLKTATSAAGREATFTIDPVSLPLDCATVVRYLVEGDWPHEEGSVVVKDGKLKLRPLNETENQVRIGGIIGGSIYWHFGSREFRRGSRQVDVQFPVVFEAQVEGLLAIKAWSPRLWLEVAASYAVTTAPYYPLDRNGLPTVEAAHVETSRGALRVSLMSPLFRAGNFTFSAGVGLRGGVMVLFDSLDTARVGGTVRGFGQVLIPALVHLTGPLSLQVTPGFGLESIRFFYTDNFGGRPIPYDAPRFGFLFQIGTRLEW